MGYRSHQSPLPLTVISDYNGFFANEAGNVQAPCLLALATWSTILSTPDEDFRLGLGSPMINAGDNSLVSTAVDADGAMRVQGGIVDIGAFEGGFPVNGATNTPSGHHASGTATPTDPLPRIRARPRQPRRRVLCHSNAAATPPSPVRRRGRQPVLPPVRTRVRRRRSFRRHHTRTTASLTVTRTPSGSVTPSAAVRHADRSTSVTHFDADDCGALTNTHRHRQPSLYRDHDRNTHRRRRTVHRRLRPEQFRLHQRARAWRQHRAGAGHAGRVSPL